MTTHTALNVSTDHQIFHLERERVDAFITAPVARDVRALAFDGKLEPGQLAALLAVVPNLEHFIWWEVRTKRAGEILGAAKLPRLTRLELSCGNFKTAGLDALVTSKLAGQLIELALIQMKVDLGVLCTSKKLVSLNSLVLGENDIRSPGLVQIAAAPFAKQLRSLRLWSNRIDGAAVAIIAKFSQLERLDLQGNSLRDAAMSALAKALPRTLTHLKLDINAKLSDKGLRAFAAARPPRLELLDLSSTGVTSAIADELDVLDLRLESLESAQSFPVIHG